MRRFAEIRAVKSALMPEFVRAISLLLVALLAFVPGTLLFGQQEAKTPDSKTQEPKISVQSNIVTVSAIVRDKKGQIISDLTKDDFTLDEDGRPQAITYFARQNDLPWLAWCLHPHARPSLIMNWKYAPTTYGEVIKNALQEAAAK